jgi:hypothetical protein
MRKLFAQLAAGLAVTAALALAGGGAASAAPSSSIGGLQGSGHIDVSSLTIVGKIDPATGKITDVTPYHPAPIAESSGGALQITSPDCDGRIDFYRIVDSSGNQLCFANSGTWTRADGYWANILYLCPGNNEGRTEWVNGSTNTWSVWRGPESDYNTCYSFGDPVPAFAVQIS